MDATARKDTIASVAVLTAIVVSALCGMFAVDVQATSEMESSSHASRASCDASALVIARIEL